MELKGIFVFANCSLLTKNLKIRIYSTIILPCVLDGCETWSLKLREEYSLGMLRRMFGPKRDEVIGRWKKKTA
jgi:hypothetical protein